MTTRIPRWRQECRIMGLAAVAPGLALPLSARMTAKSEVEEGHFFTYLWALEGVLATMCSISATITSLKRDGERERESPTKTSGGSKQVSRTSKAPINMGGPSWPRGFRHPSCPDEEERERERETYLAILAQAVSGSRRGGLSAPSASVFSASPGAASSFSLRRDAT